MITNNIQFTALVKGLNVEDKNLRREIEDKLQDFNFSYVAPPMPQGVMKIPPVMFGQTDGGHSHIQISEQAVKLFVSFDKNFNSDREKCFEYAYKRIDSITALIGSLKDPESFFGVVIQYIFENEPDAVSLINQNSVKFVGDRKFSSFSKKFSVTCADRYYVNFDLSGLRYRNDYDSMISVVVDINNRYGTEYKGEPGKKSDMEDIKKLHESISENVLLKLLHKGELNLHDAD